MVKVRNGFAAILVGFLVLGVAACGSDAKTSTATTTTSVTVATTTARTPVTITLPVVTTTTTILDKAGYAAESPDGPLRRGQKGPRVALLQKKLVVLGYDPGPTDGLFGATTQAAVKKFQTDKALQADGVAGPLTLAAVDAACQTKGGCPTA